MHRSRSFPDRCAIRDATERGKPPSLLLGMVYRMTEVEGPPDASSASETATSLLPTGVPGFDEVLGGGLSPRRMYLVEGSPGAGKTTLALQYLVEGVRRGESVLFVTLTETAEELHAAAASHGLSLEGVMIRELIPREEALQADEQYTMFHPSEVELSDTLRRVVTDVDRLHPVRVVFDSLSELRLMSGGPLRYRRQILALKHFLTARQCTVLFLDDRSGEPADQQMYSIAHGIVRLEQAHAAYGPQRRRLRVIKFRGRQIRGGSHDFVIVRGGLRVFPRLVAAEHRRDTQLETLNSGVATLDRLLGGGLQRGTSTLILGASGTGKSTLAAQFVAAALERGEPAAIFVFDESVATLLARTQSLGIELRPHLDSGQLVLRPIDPAELTPGEFEHEVRIAVEEHGARVIVIDSLNGYLAAMPEERFLVIQLHELLTYLGQLEVATLLITAQAGLLGPQLHAPVDASYLADAVVLLRHFEDRGTLRQAISVVKKRGGSHDRGIHEFWLGHGGVNIGSPLRELRGVLTGVPRPEGDAARPSVGMTPT
jgi:circadian clock protein KaiC